MSENLKRILNDGHTKMPDARNLTHVFADGRRPWAFNSANNLADPGFFYRADKGASHPARRAHDS
jgi:hypothetical protein